jgi:hypothetical protein
MEPVLLVKITFMIKQLCRNYQKVLFGILCLSFVACNNDGSTKNTDAGLTGDSLKQTTMPTDTFPRPLDSFAKKDDNNHEH